MRIAHFTDLYFPQISGVAAAILNSSEELGKRGHEVLIVAPRLSAEDDGNGFPQNVSVLRLNSLPLPFYPNVRTAFLGFSRLHRELRSFNPDVIHIHTPMMMGWYGRRAARIFGVPLIGTNHLFLTKDNANFFRVFTTNSHISGALGKIALAQFRQLYNSCDRRIAPSALLAEQLGNEGFLPFDCVPNGISKVSVLGSESAKGASVRKRYRLKEKVVLHFGRLSREKNIDQVIRAFALLGTHLSETSLLLIGGGPDVERLRSLIRTLRIEDSVVFAGEISHQELLESGVLSVADLFVTASPMESQGMVIIEAMSFGLPIVAVGEGAVPEVVGENGLLLAKGDVAAMAARVIEVLTRPDLAKKLRRLSLERAEFFSLPRVTDRLLEIYREAISAKERSKKAPPSL